MLIGTIGITCTVIHGREASVQLGGSWEVANFSNVEVPSTLLHDDDGVYHIRVNTLISLLIRETQNEYCTAPDAVQKVFARAADASHIFVGTSLTTFVGQEYTYPQYGYREISRLDTIVSGEFDHSSSQKMFDVRNPNISRVRFTDMPCYNTYKYVRVDPSTHFVLYLIDRGRPPPPRQASEYYGSDSYASRSGPPPAAHRPQCSPLELSRSSSPTSLLRLASEQPDQETLERTHDGPKHLDPSKSQSRYQEQRHHSAPPHPNKYIANGSPSSFVDVDTQVHASVQHLLMPPYDPHMIDASLSPSNNLQQYEPQYQSALPNGLLQYPLLSNSHEPQQPPTPILPPWDSQPPCETQSTGRTPQRVETTTQLHDGASLPFDDPVLGDLPEENEKAKELNELLHQDYHIPQDTLTLAHFAKRFSRGKSEHLISMVQNHRAMLRVLELLALADRGEVDVNATVTINGEVFSAEDLVVKKFGWTYSQFRRKIGWYGTAEKAARTMRWKQSVPNTCKLVVPLPS